MLKRTNVYAHTLSRTKQVEIGVLKALDHPNIIHLADVFETETRIYMVRAVRFAWLACGPPTCLLYDRPVGFGWATGGGGRGVPCLSRCR